MNSSKRNPPYKYLIWLIPACLIILYLIWKIFWSIPDPKFTSNPNPYIFDDSHKYSFRPLSVYSFPEDRVWILVWDPDYPYDYECSAAYLLNLKSENIEGVLNYANPLWNYQDKTLTISDRSSFGDTFKPAKYGILNRKTGRYIPLCNGDVDYWGEPSPNGERIRFVWWSPRVGNLPSYKHFIFDLVEEKIIHNEPVENYHGGGWLSDEELVIRDQAGNLIIYNLPNGEKRILIELEQITEFLNSHGIFYKLHPSDNSLYYWIRPVWNGSDYEIILEGGISENRIWFIRIDMDQMVLDLLFKNFQFDWVPNRGDFDQSLEYYIYSGHRDTRDSNAVYIYDIDSCATRTLVMGNPENDCYSAPQFYKNKIIYRRSSNSIWSMNFDGSDNRQLFPPPATK